MDVFLWLFFVGSIACSFPCSGGLLFQKHTKNLSCLSRADIYFVIDGSTRVTNSNFMAMKSFIKSLIAGMHVGSGDVRVGIIQIGNHSQLEFNLSSSTTKHNLTRRIDRITKVGGERKTYDALRILRQRGFNSAQGDRTGVTNIAIVIIFGVSDSSVRTISEAMSNNRAHILTFVVDISGVVGLHELSTMAYPFKLEVSTFWDLRAREFILLSQICKTVSLQPGVAIGDCRRRPEIGVTSLRTQGELHLIDRRRSK
ncbi:hypothetical protein ScPMuIL_014108 [Solemya velum]